MSESEDIRLLLDGLEVGSISELKELVDLARRFDRIVSPRARAFVCEVDESAGLASEAEPR